MVVRLFRVWSNLACLTVALAVVHPSLADEHTDYTTLNADSLIAGCWNKFDDKVSSQSPAIARDGNLDVVLCLEEVILDETDILFPKGDPLTREQVAKKLNKLRFAAGELYWAIYNENTSCNPTCGTIWHPAHLASLTKILEEMIRDIVNVRKLQEF